MEKVLAARLQISIEEAGRRTRDAEVLGPRTAITGNRWNRCGLNFAAAQAEDGLIGAEHPPSPGSSSRSCPTQWTPKPVAPQSRIWPATPREFGPAEYRSAVDLMLALLHPDGDFDDAERRRRRGVTLGRPQADGSRTITGY